jgi:enoyl-CoA hydratase
LILQFCKTAIDTGMQMDLESGLELEIGLWAESYATEDHHEGIAAFIEKRKPQFKDK